MDMEINETTTPVPANQSYNRRDRSYFSAARIDHLKNWTRVCDTSHPECNPRGKTLPTRVLDINDLSSIKLVEPRGLNVRYITLSHCWGSANGFLTTQANIKSRRRGFSIEETPPSFRDAILVTRALGIRYLWVDSLCIIQGDALDWELEGGKMADVYSHAYLTISAANSDSDSRGFLAPRRVEYIPIQVSAGDGLCATAYLHIKKHWYDRKEEPLDDRAWTLQEQYLSPRNVRYCANEMSWRCRRCAWNESAADSDNLRQWERPWTELVEEFSRRKLTYDTDKFPAMAGVASSVAHINGNNYCAGLWVGNMPDELLFERNSEGRASGCVAPSWSWAALNGPITFVHPRVDGYSRLPSVRILGHDVQASAENRFGGLIYRGCLRLQAHLAILERTSRSSSPGTSNYRLKHQKLQQLGNSPVIRCKFDTIEPDSTALLALILAYSVNIPAPGAPLQSHSRILPFGEVDVDHEPEPPPREWDGIYGILVANRQQSHQPRRRSFKASLLGRARQKPLPSYERRGYFEILKLQGVQGLQIISHYPPMEALLY